MNSKGSSDRYLTILGCLPALLLPSCASFTPSLRLTAVGRSASAAIESVGTPKEQTPVSIRVRTAKQLLLGEVVLSEPTSAPCSGGRRAESVSVDGRDAAERSYIQGEHVVVAKFFFHRDTPDFPRVIDLELRDAEKRECLRLPITGRVIDYVQEPRLVMVGGFDFYGGSAVAGNVGSGSLRFGYGGWLGANRITAESGIGFATCAEAVCGREGKDDTLRMAAGLPIALSLQRVRVFEHGTSQFAFGWGLGLRYVGMFTILPAFGGDRSRVVHSVLIVPSWAVGDNLPFSFGTRGRGATWEFEIPFGIRAAAGEKDPELGFTIGFGLRGAGPI